MIDLIANAIPAFILLLVVEFLTLRNAHDHDHDHDDDHDHAPVGYEPRDTRTSLAMGLGNVVTNIGWKALVLASLAGLYELSPLRLDSGAWWVWVLLFFADDFSYYWSHRAGHRIRILWASHVVHHSSEHYNLSTALRQPWTPAETFLFWAWMPLVGFSPWMVLLAQSWNLLYQFWIHTETIGKLPRLYEAIFNTPSHHRAHHGSQEQYLDKNYGGILILWDRLFGSFEPERERVRYGLTTNVGTFNPVRVAFHEYAAIWRDVRRAPTWRAGLGYMFRGPGWEPAVASAVPCQAPRPSTRRLMSMTGTSVATARSSRRS
jgi:sterol desaturase/sphingolipid hydroxylase (fatty acid hydroxylase superfamily)